MMLYKKKDEIIFFTRIAIVAFLFIISNFLYTFINITLAQDGGIYEDINSCSSEPLNLKSSTGQLKLTGEGAGYQAYEDPAKGFEVIVANVIRTFLSFLGIVFLILIIYGGYTWMTAHGNEEKVTTARKTIIEATIGLAIVLASYAITYYIVDRLTNATL